MNYINDKEMPILFECEVDDLNRGCPLSFMSQFPAEDEVLIPAMSYIEMTGNPYVMEASKGSRDFVTVYPARIHCNQKSQVSPSFRRQDLFACFDLTNGLSFVALHAASM